MAGDDFDPFTAEDLKTLLHEESCNSENEGWKFLKKTNDGDEIWRKSQENQAVHLIKGLLKFPGIPPKDIIELITNLDVRRKWEKRFSTIEVLEEYKHYRVVYWYVDMPVGVSNRDIVQNITQRYDESQQLTYIMYKNGTHPTKPVQPGVVRSETVLSGTLIRPSKGDPNSTDVTILLQNDPKGWIPTFIVNSFTASAPLEWKQSLSEFYHNVYKTEK